MIDETTERPIDEIRTGNASFMLPSLIDHLNFSDNVETSEVKERIKTAESALDLGSGDGNNFFTLEKIAPELKTIATVDVVTKPLENYIRSIAPVQVTHYPQYINQFLGESRRSYDLVVMTGVPDHGLNTETQYANLARNVSEKGVLLETDDTRLSKREMLKNFDLIVDVPHIGAPANRIWQRKATT